MIEVWFSSISDLRAAGIRTLLTEAEADRVSRLAIKARAQSEASAGIVRLAAGRQLQVSPKNVRIDRTCKFCGKPHAGPALIDHNDLSLSVSHSSDALLVCLSRSRRVGVDIEYARDLDAEALARQVLSPVERTQWSTSRDLLTYWTRKEAVTKSIGLGLRVDLRRITMSPPWEVARIIGIADNRVPEDVQISDLSLGPDYIAALAGIGSAPLKPQILDARTLIVGGR